MCFAFSMLFQLLGEHHQSLPCTVRLFYDSAYALDAVIGVNGIRCNANLILRTTFWLWKLQRAFPTVRLVARWVRGHSKVLGNELADAAAKKGASGLVSLALTPVHPDAFPPQ